MPGRFSAKKTGSGRPITRVKGESISSRQFVSWRMPSSNKETGAIRFAPHMAENRISRVVTAVIVHSLSDQIPAFVTAFNESRCAAPNAG